MHLVPARRLAHTGEYYFSRKLRELAALNAAGADIVSLGIGSPDLPPHPSVVAALADTAALPTAHGYQSYQGTPALRQAMAGFYERSYGVALDPASEILPLLGSKEGLMHLGMAFLDPGDEVLLPNPGYPTYQAVAEVCGATPRPYDLTAAVGWLPDLSALAATDLRRVKMMFVNYPHMPTGTAASPAFLAELVAFATAHGIMLVHDNPYGFTLNDAPPLSLLAVPGARAVALELNSQQEPQPGWLARGHARGPGRLADRSAALQKPDGFGHVSGRAAGGRGGAGAGRGLVQWAERDLPRPPRAGAEAARNAGLRGRARPNGPVRMGRRAARFCRRLRVQRCRAGWSARVSHAGRRVWLEWKWLRARQFVSAGRAARRSGV